MSSNNNDSKMFNYENDPDRSSSNESDDNNQVMEDKENNSGGMESTNSFSEVKKEAIQASKPHLTIETNFNASPGSTPTGTPVGTPRGTPRGKRVGTPKRNMVGRWTQEEHELFLEGLQKYGKSWKKIAQLIRTRTLVQIRTHAQKYLQKKKWSGDSSPAMMTVKSSLHPHHRPIMHHGQGIPMSMIQHHPMLSPSHFAYHDSTRHVQPFFDSPSSWHLNQCLDNFHFSTPPMPSSPASSIDMDKDFGECIDVHTTLSSAADDLRLLDLSDLADDSNLDELLGTNESLDWLADCVTTDLEDGSPMDHIHTSKSNNDCMILPAASSRPDEKLSTGPTPIAAKKRVLHPATYKHMTGPSIMPAHPQDYNAYVWSSPPQTFLPFQPRMSGIL